MTPEERRARYAKMKKDNEKSGGGGDFLKPTYFKIKEGMNRLRFIPRMGEIDFWAEVVETWRAGPSYRGPITRPSDPSQPDPVGDLIQKLSTSQDPIDKKRHDQLLKDTNTSKKAFVLDRDAPELGPQLMTLNWTIFNEVLSLLADSEYGDIDDPENGTDLKISYVPGVKKQGGGWAKKPEYSVVPSRATSALNFPEALEEDLFKKFRVLEPTGVDFANAVLEGREQEFIEERKAAREAGEAPPNPNAMDIDTSTLPFGATEPSNPTPAHGTDAAVQKQLEALQSAPPPPPVTDPVTKTDPSLLTRKYWIVDEKNETVARTGPQIQDLVNMGEENISCLAQDDPDKTWKTPKTYGFHKVVQSQVGKDLEEALK